MQSDTLDRRCHQFVSGDLIPVGKALSTVVPENLHLMARNLSPGEERSALLKMAEEWDPLADQQEHQTGPAGIGDRHVRKSPRRPVS